MTPEVADSNSDSQRNSRGDPAMLTENERKVLADWNVFVKNVPPSIEGLRTNYEKWSEEQNKDLPQIRSYEEAVTLRPGLTADVAVPKDRGPHPVLLYLHGGG